MCDTDAGRPSVKVFNPPGGKSSLNLGGYGGNASEDDPGNNKIGAKSSGGRCPPNKQNAQSALRQYDMNVSQISAPNRATNNNPYPLQYSSINAPRGNQQ